METSLSILLGRHSGMMKKQIRQIHSIFCHAGPQFSSPLQSIIKGFCSKTSWSPLKSPYTLEILTRTVKKTAIAVFSSS